MARARILLVEPMTWLRDMEEEMLTRAGYHPCPAATAEAALAQASFHPPQAVVTRFQLDGKLTGVNLIEALRAQGCYAPVIGLTGRPEHSEAFERVGAQAVVDLPFRATTLLDAIRRALTSV
jgi:DNA-binding NtrC family response regulator